MSSSYIKVMLYSAAHFLVDLACAYLLFFSARGTEQWLLCVLVYNFCAFALQMPAGLLADRWDRNAVCAASGCILTASAFGLRGIPLAAAVTAGVGNCLFHIGGGIDVLNISREKSGPLGIFVAPGAFGLYLGTLYGKRGMDAGIYIAAVLLLAAAMILLLQYVSERTFRSGNEPLSLRAVSLASVHRRDLPDKIRLKASTAVGAAACFLLVVCLRSYVGLTLSFPWKGQGSNGLMLLCAVVLGKMAGGILADIFGVLRVSAVSLGLAAMLFLFSGYPPAGIAAVFLFNMTMPVTLWAVSQILPGARGFTFGFLTFGLFLGFIPVYLGLDPLFSDGAGFASASVISLALLCSGLTSAGSEWTGHGLTRNISK